MTLFRVYLLSDRLGLGWVFTVGLGGLGVFGGLAGSGSSLVVLVSDVHGMWVGGFMA